MVRLSDLPEHEREHLIGKTLPPLSPPAWVSQAKPVAEMRIALITTAGLHRRDDAAFSMVDLSYRVIPGEIEADALTMTHSSVHFDRTGFREDPNLVFPIDRLRELERDGVIGSVADYHYSLMGAGWSPEQIEPTMRELGELLRRDAVDAVCLVPV